MSRNQCPNRNTFDRVDSLLLAMRSRAKDRLLRLPRTVGVEGAASVVRRQTDSSEQAPIS